MHNQSTLKLVRYLMEINSIGARIIEINKGLIQDIYAQDYSIPKGAEVIDASDCTILPGFIDSHIHFMGASMPYINEIEKHSWGKLASEGISSFPGASVTPAYEWCYINY